MPQNKPQNSPQNSSHEPTPEQLQAQFGIPDAVAFDRRDGGLTRATITTPSATGAVHPHGAHVTSFQPQGQPDALFVSPRSRFAPGEPIRGGIPVCFPWFANHGEPQHGPARLQPWQIIDTATRGDESTIEFALNIAPFHAHLRVTVGPALSLAMQVRNTSDAPATFELALHTYFAVSDVRQIEIAGLEGRPYLDKTQDYAECTQNEPIRIEGETDRVYMNTTDTCTLHDPGHGRRITIEKHDAHSTIVWNPWVKKAARTEDVGNDDWQRFVCIESGNVHDNAVTLQPDQSHETDVRIGVEAD